MAERQAWFCPACQKHHGPHIDTCPAPDAISIPGAIPVWPAQRHQPHPGWKPGTGDPYTRPWYGQCAFGIATATYGMN